MKSLNNGAIQHSIPSVAWLWTGSPFKEWIIHNIVGDYWDKILDPQTRENHKSTKTTIEREILIFDTQFVYLNSFSPQFANHSKYNEFFRFGGFSFSLFPLFSFSFSFHGLVNVLLSPWSYPFAPIADYGLVWIQMTNV